MQKHDPGLEMEVLQFLQETSQVCDLTEVMDACVICNESSMSNYIDRVVRDSDPAQKKLAVPFLFSFVLAR